MWFGMCGGGRSIAAGFLLEGLLMVVISTCLVCLESNFAVGEVLKVKNVQGRI